MTPHNPTEDFTNNLVNALDTFRPDWWKKYFDAQDWYEIATAAHRKDYELMHRIINSRKCSAANDLSFVISAAVSAGIVRHP